MDKNSIFIAILFLAIGFGGGYFAGAGKPNPGTHVMPGGVVMKDSETAMDTAMHNMTTGLEGKTADEFDKAFLTEMIVHHEGAVAMAQAALTNAKHDELKQMAQAIISAQTTEIAQMQQWLKSWYNQ